MLKWLRRNKHVGKAGEVANHRWEGAGKTRTDITGIITHSYFTRQVPDT
jgi:hypothetical protein